ncbi:MAG: hypothetical protein AAB019_03725 [Planctomycetota bacterium]
MTKSEAISEVFITALRTLSKRNRIFILEKLLADNEFADDLFDIALTLQRRKEKPLSYDSVRREIKRTGCL